MTPEHGLQAAYVRGARGRRMRPVLLPGNLVAGPPVGPQRQPIGAGRGRAGAQPRAVAGRALPAAAIDWATALTATALPEAQPYPRLYQALDGLLAAIEAAPSASGWGAALVRYELLLLAELGFGLDLERCAVTGVE